MKKVKAARAEFFDSAAGKTPFLSVEIEGALFFVAPNGSELQRRLFVDRQATSIGRLERAAPLLSRRDVFVDVGANIGTTTIAALSKHGFARAVAIEPDPENVRMLRINLAANLLAERVHVIHAAVSDRTGKSRVVPGRGEGESKVRVRRHALDRLVSRGLIAPERVGLLWIDAAGNELRVLSGASAILEARVPVVTALRARRSEWSETRDRLPELLGEYRRFYDLGQFVMPGGPALRIELTPWLDGLRGSADLLALP